MMSVSAEHTNKFISKILPPHTRHFSKISSDNDNFIFAGLDKDEDECSDTINLIAALK